MSRDFDEQWERDDHREPTRHRERKPRPQIVASGTVRSAFVKSEPAQEPTWLRILREAGCL